MKRFTGIVLCFLLVLLVSTAGAANTFTSGDWEYKYLGNNTAEIVSYSGSADVLEIPTELDGMAVVSIGERAF